MAAAFRDLALPATPARAIGDTTPKEHTPARAIHGTTPIPITPARVVDPLGVIRTLGGLLDDLEQVRKANGNRISAVTRDEGSVHPALSLASDELLAVEHHAVLELVRAWRQHPLAEWSASQKGVGEKSIARLVALIGDPADRSNPAKLWAYCGVGNPNLRPHPGMSQAEVFKLGRARAKSQVWLIATAMTKQRCAACTTASRDRAARKGEDDQGWVPPPADCECVERGFVGRARYDARRAVTQTRVHERACGPCHAKAGEAWKPGHQHADALRVIGKAFLLDLWKEARAGHMPHDTHGGHARAGGTNRKDER